KGIGEFSRFREAITGSLVAQLDVDSKFIPAIEAALGRNLHALVLRDADAACEIIAQLKKQKLGQAALVIPQSTGPAQQSERKAQIAELTKQQGALGRERDSLSAKRDEEKSALETASQLRRESTEAERKIDNLRSEQAALERQVAVADDRITQLERELQAIRDQLTKEQTELTTFETAQKQSTQREEELTEKINELRLAVATE